MAVKFHDFIFKLRSLGLGITPFIVEFITHAKDINIGSKGPSVGENEINFVALIVDIDAKMHGLIGERSLI